MKILFKNKTRYSSQVYQKFLEFHQSLYGAKYTAVIAIAILLILFVVMMQLRYRKFGLAISIVAIVIIALIMEYKRNSTTIKDEFSSKKIQEQQVFSFIFYEKLIRIRENENLNKVYYIKYYEIYKVFETVDFFYIYLDKSHALLLKKNCFVIGDASEFSKFIRKKCMFRYRHRE